MLFLFLGVYFLTVALLDLYKEGLDVVDKRYKFYVAYDQTILYSKNITVGSNQVQSLQQLWIEGYGGYSESINAFLWVNDTYFETYVNNTVSVQFHNELYEQM